jgi:hypothetical protein
MSHREFTIEESGGGDMFLIVGHLLVEEVELVLQIV